MHSRWGSDVTVLLGDYLYIKSMGLALTPDRLDIVRQLCDVTLRMIEGELYQLSKKGDVMISEDEHLDIVRRKTAYLFGGCARIGGILGNATPEQERALEQYGISLGHVVPADRRPPGFLGRRNRRSASRSAATCAKAR